LKKQIFVDRKKLSVIGRKKSNLPIKKDYNLAESRKSLGELSPVIKDAHGNIIDGFHRLGENQSWFSITVPQIDTPVKLELARLTVNYVRRRVRPFELRLRIGFLIKTGGLTPREISEMTGISLRTINRYTPQRLKNQKLVEAGKKGAKAIAKKLEDNKRLPVAKTAFEPGSE